MTDTTRDLIQRLARELDLYRQMVRDDTTSTHPLADEARAFLAQPEPKPPSLEEHAQADLKRLIALIPTEGAIAMAEPIRKALEALPDG